MSRDLGRLLRPRSVAVIGGGWGRAVIGQMRRAGFAGRIWPVHPRLGEIEGIPCLARLEDLPEAPDAAYVAVNREATIETVAALARMGAGGAVCFASGFAETGDGDHQERLLAAAGAMPVLGPNCYGLLNHVDGVALWPDQHGGRRVARGVAIVSQSSNIAVNITMQARGLPIGHVVCAGNQAQTGIGEIGAALLADPSVTALGFHIEGIGDAAAFAAMAEMADAAGKPVIALKSGRSQAARWAAGSHTAALTGEGAASSAFLRRCRVAEVSCIGTLLEALKLAHLFGRLPGGRIASLSCSGGEAGLMADLAADAGLELPPPPPARARDLARALGPMVAIANPLDYHTFVWGDRARMAEVFGAMTGPPYDLTVLVLDMPHGGRCDPEGWRPAVAALEDVQARGGARIALLSSLPENLPETLADRLMAAGIAPLSGMRDGLAAIACLAFPPDPGAGWRPLPPLPQAPARLLDEAEAKARLHAAGVPVPEGVRADDLSGAAAAARALGGRVALKGLGLAHKTEAGAVRLDLSPGDIAGFGMPGPAGYLVERMVEGGVAELLVGLRRDPVYGATLTLGTGGIMAELLADSVTLILPVTGAGIRDALGRLRLFALLSGHRGGPPADIDAAVAVALALSGILTADPALEEIEINPLILRAAGHGAMAADALIRRRQP